MSHTAAPLPEPIARALRILRRQRWIAREALGHDPPGCKHHPEEASMEENLRRVLAAIERAGASWALVGAEAVNLYVGPRATEDFDLVVAAGGFEAALREIRLEFNGPPEVDIGAAVRLPTLAIDLIRSSCHELFRIAIDRARPAGPMRVPPPEVVMALKFLSSISPWRHEDDRKQDALDLIRVYRAVGREGDRAELLRLGGLAYPGAERELGELLGKIDRGEPITI
ncbi:MAG: hypothetical protein HY744_16215 [Deltaproteobacteria bacterium]|nr:hypothetical protein [Deltaproteobacteria bacterium]